MVAMQVVAEESRELHIIFTSDFSGIFNTWSVFEPSITLAVDIINNSTDILKGFKIIPHFMDSHVSSSPHIFY